MFRIVRAAWTASSVDICATVARRPFASDRVNVRLAFVKGFDSGGRFCTDFCGRGRNEEVRMGLFEPFMDWSGVAYESGHANPKALIM